MAVRDVEEVILERGDGVGTIVQGGDAGDRVGRQRCPALEFGQLCGRQESGEDGGAGRGVVGPEGGAGEGGLWLEVGVRVGAGVRLGQNGV